MKRNEMHSGWFALKCAGRGFLYCLRSQRNMRIHFMAAVGVLLAGGLADFQREEFCLLLLTVGAVGVAEVFNTAVETVVDMITPEYHPLAAVAKDVAAGAVLLAAAVAVVIGVLLFGPRILPWLWLS